jgi:Ca2+-binding RTX toxin-like protein
MDDFATLPGGIYIGGPGANLVNADTDITGGFDNLILTFGGRDTVNAGQGDDAVMLGKGDDVASGGSGNDTVLGEKGDDRIGGDAGDDVIEGENGKDTLDGGTGDDAISGGKQDDILAGGEGRDVLDGGDGDDLISGGAGNDTIVGGDGKDTLAGGAGKDVFVFESGFGKDVVLDFQKGVDKLEIQANINGLGIATPGDLAPYISGNAVSAEIKLGGDTIRLVGVSRNDLLSNLSDYVKIV